MKILECSSKGDRRFSAFYAKVVVGGVLQSIEDHYQLAKRFRQGVWIIRPHTWRDAKGKKPVHFDIAGKAYPVELLSEFYYALWHRFLSERPDLVEFLKGFDGYTDMFARPGGNSQAECIRAYVKDNRPVKFQLP